MKRHTKNSGRINISKYTENSLLSWRKFKRDCIAFGFSHFTRFSGNGAVVMAMAVAAAVFQHHYFRIRLMYGKQKSNWDLIKMNKKQRANVQCFNRWLHVFHHMSEVKLKFVWENNCFHCFHFFQTLYSCSIPFTSLIEISIFKLTFSFSTAIFKGKTYPLQNETLPRNANVCCICTTNIDQISNSILPHL